ncbi:poliovirus receptor homolog [Polyodon spathula]|uniref:poliovirus receptor homolog n=1 Tax=Polyodon spathula TaxID=7913 RepID=UPI001B7F6176|nr:poliovirus receptor homolog [Polyodon spathula]XP_041091160.1 poliovirus receptor homolog [Polyodon spathula]
MSRRQHDFPVLKRHASLITLLFCILVLQAADCQRVKVEPEVSSFPGQNVTLRCSFSDPTGEVKKSQVTWIRETPDGKKVNIAVFNPQFGASYPEKSIEGRVAFRDPSLQDPSIVLQGVTMGDEGNYICEYATYPSGNEEGTTRLFVLAKPTNNATVLPVQAGPAPVAVARCVSANGKPPSEITWVSALPGNGTNSAVKNSDGTVTVTSEYRVTPSAALNGQDLGCVIQHKTLSKPESFQLKLSIEYPPQVKISGYDGNWFLGREGVELHCAAKANPPTTNVVWRTLSGVLPRSVEVSGPVLKVMKVDSELNTTFICEAQNSIGTGKQEHSILVRESPPQPQGSDPGMVVGVVVSCLLAVLLITGLVIFCLRRKKRDQGYQSGGQQGGCDPKTRVFGGGNNNGTAFAYRRDPSEATTERAAPPPTAQDILLSREMDTLEKSKFDLEVDEGYDRFDESFGESRPVLQLRHGGEDEVAGYADDDMESQRDGSVISRTAVYV